MFEERNAAGGLDDIIGQYPTREEAESAAHTAAVLNRSLTQYQIGIQTVNGLKLLVEGELERKTIIKLTNTFKGE